MESSGQAHQLCSNLRAHDEGQVGRNGGHPGFHKLEDLHRADERSNSSNRYLLGQMKAATAAKELARVLMY